MPMTMTTWKLVASESALGWQGSKPGGKHYGTVEVLDGEAEMDGDQITGGSFEIDLTSIRNEDIGNDAMRERLVSHLKSKDFFHVEEHPKAYFEITEIETATNGDQDAEEDFTHVVTGDLTIRGNTHRISFPASIGMDDMIMSVRSGEIKLDRTRWEVNHMSRRLFAGLKDSFIHDEMVLKLDLEFSRN